MNSHVIPVRLGEPLAEVGERTNIAAELRPASKLSIAPRPGIQHDHGDWRIPALGLCLVFAVLLLLEMHQVSKDNFGAFSTYYAAGLRMREGGNPYGRMGVYPYVYPPLYAFICQPLTYLPRQQAARIIAILDGVILMAAIFFAARAVVARFGGRGTHATVLWVALIAAFITLFPMHKEIKGMQANGLLVLSMVLAICLLDDHPVFAGLALAFGISIKYVPVIGLVYFLIRRRWTAAISALAGCILFTLLPAITLGWNTNLHYQLVANRGLATLFGGLPPDDAARVHGLAELTNISVPGTMTRMVEALRWPHAVGLALTTLVLAGWAGVVIWFYIQRRVSLFRWPVSHAQAAEPYRWLVILEWSLLAMLPLAFTPDSEQVFAIMPATLIAAMLIMENKSRDRRSLIWGLALVLMSLLLPVALMGSRLSHLWNGVGTPCWLLLIALALIWRRGLDASAIASRPTSKI